MKFNKLIPELSVKNFDKSLYFYIRILGFTKEYERKESKFAFMNLQGSQIMIEEINDHWNTGKLEYPFGRGINFQIEVDNINFVLKKLNKENYPLFKKPKENWYRKDDIFIGNKEFLVMDPDGYLLRFCEDIGTKQIEDIKD
ncbi:aldoketomutase [Candidatus Woesearchaeota archaeon]|nr:MAG: aldoketomutase [Candidatus Woesearchaeota archaeon]